MPNNAITLTSEIKKALHTIDYPFLISGSIIIAVLGLFLVLGLNPDLISSPPESHLGFTLSMTAIYIAFIIGTVVGTVITQFYKPWVLRYVNVPNDIEKIKDGLIALGAYVTTLENAVNPKQIGRIFRYIHQQINKIPLIQADIEELKEDKEREYRHIARQNQDYFRLRWKNTQLKNENKELRKQMSGLNDRVKTLEDKLETVEQNKKEDSQLFSEKTHTQNTEHE